MNFILTNKKCILFLLILYVGLITILSLISVPNDTNITNIKHIDKIVHFCFYFGLTILLLIFAQLHNIKRETSAKIGLVIAAILYSIIIEITQSRVGRSFEIYDIIANSIGAITAYALFSTKRAKKFFKDKI